MILPPTPRHFLDFPFAFYRTVQQQNGFNLMLHTDHIIIKSLPGKTVMGTIFEFVIRKYHSLALLGKHEVDLYLERSIPSTTKHLYFLFY